MFIKYSDKDCRFLENNASVLADVMVTGDKWFFFPYYLRQVGDGIFEEISFENLPQKFKDKIMEMRNTEPKPNQEKSIKWD